MPLNNYKQFIKIIFGTYTQENVSTILQKKDQDLPFSFNKNCVSFGSAINKMLLNTHMCILTSTYFSIYYKGLQGYLRKEVGVGLSLRFLLGGWRYPPSNQLKTFPGHIKSFIIKENHIGPAALAKSFGINKQTDKPSVSFIFQDGAF